MTTTTRHVCRFDPTHGIFPTPVVLRQHYEQVHADVFVPQRSAKFMYKCRLCGGIYRAPDSHLTTMHPDAQESPRRTHYFDRLDKLPRNDAPDSPNGLSRVDDQLARLATSDVAPRHVGPWTVDDIVLPVVEQLAKPSGKVPVAALAALFVWRDQTAAMLRDVTGRG